MKKLQLAEANIIDIHCHVAGIGEGNSGCFVSPDLKDNLRYRFFLKAFGVIQKDLEKNGDSYVFKLLSKKIRSSKYVNSAVVLALDGVVGNDGALDYQKTEVYIPNSFVASETAKFNNLYYGASINPDRKDAIERLENVFKEGALLIKWIPSVQHFDPADKRYVPFYSRLKELGLPLLTHTGDEHSFTRACNEFSDPRRLDLPLKIGVTVIAAHAASSGRSEGEKNMSRLLEMFLEYKNLYADISSLTQLNKLGCLTRLIKYKEFHGRLLYGSDMPLIATPIVSPWFFPFNLTIREIISLNRIDNIWDQDVLLKHALGVPVEVFSKSHEVLDYGRGLKNSGAVNSI